MRSLVRIDTFAIRTPKVRDIMFDDMVRGTAAGVVVPLECPADALELQELQELRALAAYRARQARGEDAGVPHEEAYRRVFGQDKA